MRNNGKGGMQTSGVSGSIICPKCGKLVARVLTKWCGVDAYMHYTKTGVVWHVRKADGAWVSRRSELAALKALEVTAP